MKRIKASRSHCIYCSVGKGETKDHIPPRGFIEDPVPNGVNLISVPCCEKCRQYDQANDNLMRDVFSSLELTESNPYVVRHIIPRRDRSLDMGHNLPTLNSMTENVERLDSSGASLGKDLAFNFKDPRIRRFLERLGRALLFHCHGLGYFEADFDFVPLASAPQNFKNIVSSFPNSRILGALTYAASPLLKNLYWVILRFFDGVEFLLRFERR